MRFFAKNTEHGLKPLYPADQDESKKLSLNEVYEVDIKKKRNIGFHRRFFALLNLGWQNTSLDMPFETYRKYIIMKAGYFEVYHTEKGAFYDSKSISFSSMDQDQFEEVYSRVLDVIAKDIDTEKESIVNELINFM
jgi:hypothetical protein